MQTDSSGGGWWGPIAANYKLFQAVGMLSVLCSLPMLYGATWGPDATVPWHDRFHFICAHAVMFFGLEACSAGGVTGEYPAEPRTSIMQPLCRSAVCARMVFDALSDLALSRSLLAAV